MHKATLKRLVREHALDRVVEINSGKEVEIYVTDVDGNVNEKRTETIMELFCSEVANWGGYKTGYGAWVLQEGYVSKGDWNDKSSAHHY